MTSLGVFGTVLTPYTYILYSSCSVVEVKGCPSTPPSLLANKYEHLLEPGVRPEVFFDPLTDELGTAPKFQCISPGHVRSYMSHKVIHES